MTAPVIEDLAPDLAFGARVSGVDRETLADAGARRALVDLFERRGMIVFTGCEPSAAFQAELSRVFGPLKDHPTHSTARVDDNAVPGVIDMHYRVPTDGSEGGLVEIEGTKLAKWSPWHFDHCYNDELNLAGVLRSIVVPPEGGMTGFIDGIEMYRNLPEALRDAIEGENILYVLDVRKSKLLFGRPASLRTFGETPYTMGSVREGLTFPRAIHPAVWTRPDGEKVLHVSPWMAVGIEGRETEAGDALLEQVCRTMVEHARPYWHRWQPGDMVIWDNRRLLHAVSGADPRFERRMQRTTISGDYGLGRFEGDKRPGEVQRELVP